MIHLFYSLWTGLLLYQPNKSGTRELPESALVTEHLEHLEPEAVHPSRLYHSRFLESLLLPIFCVFTYTAINNPPEETWPTRKYNQGDGEEGGRTNWITTSWQKTWRHRKVRLRARAAFARASIRVPTCFCVCESGHGGGRKQPGDHVSSKLKTELDFFSPSFFFFCTKQENRGAIWGLLWHFIPLLYYRPLQSRRCLVRNDVT